MVYDPPKTLLGSKLNLLNLQHRRPPHKAALTVAVQRGGNTNLAQVTWEAACKFNNCSVVWQQETLI